MADYSKKIGKMQFDGLIADITPKTVVQAGTIKKLTATTVLQRGTLLAKADDGNLVVFCTKVTTGEGDSATVSTLKNAYAVLCDNVEIGTDDNVTVPVYTKGCFNLEKVIAADSYTITDADIDEFGKNGIVFKNCSKVEEEE